MKTNTIFLIGMALIVSACTPKYSEVPRAKNFENIEQHVLQAAKHWDLINNEVSKQLVERLAGKVGKDEFIFISDPHSIYSKNLYQDVVSGLVAAGYTVLKPEPNKNKLKSLQVPPAHQVLIELNPTIIKFSGSTPRTEIVIDVTVSRQNRHIAIIKEICYIVEYDTNLYHALENQEPLIHEYQVVGAGK